MALPKSFLFTDLYQLTMLQGYHRAGIANRPACFDLFFRKNPFDGGYALFAGLEDALRFLEKARFSEEDIEYLKSLGLFEDAFLEYLGKFRFTGEVHSVPEGTPVFPDEPILRVVAPLAEAQVVESGILNIVNFQTLIATKSARVCQEAGKDNVFEFGLRRAQGPDGALSASRSAYIGGCAGTSNVEAGKVFGIPVKGTHAHSWVMAFPSELESFRKFVEIYPENSILLVDTYDTLKSGLPNAIKVGREMKERGERLLAVRIDSGDLAFLSIEARRLLDEAGLRETKIVASSELDEKIIHDLRIQGAKIDIYGVGTRLVTANGEPALSGVYKLSALKNEAGEWEAKLKISDNIHKATLPGVKQVWRIYNGDGWMAGDIVDFENAARDFNGGVWGFHPFIEYQKKFYDNIKETEPLLTKVFSGGKVTAALPKLPEIRERASAKLSALHPTMRRLLNPHVYKVSLGKTLMTETRRLRKR